MSYDMQVTFEVDDRAVYASEQAEFLAARERCNRLIGSDRFRGATGYFSLNIWAMRLLRIVMRELGMVTCPPKPDWAALPDIAAFEAAMDADFGTPGIPEHKLMSNDMQLVCAREVSAALVLYDSYPDREQATVILLHAVEQEMRDAEPDDRERDSGSADDRPLALAFWQTWISYLRLAAVAGGFRVY